MTDITELTSVQKNANIHRLSRLIAYAPNDELRQLAVEVEQYTEQLIEALEKAQQEAEELSKFKEVMTSAAEALKAGSPLNLESLFKGELASAMFAMMLAGEFIRSGATNYLELLYDVPEFGEMTVTLQKVEGKTPGQRIAELEESNAQVIQSRDHYKRMTEEGLKQLAESRTVTVEPFRSFVTDADLAALHRFAECCDDPESGGHDLEKEQVRRLEEIGALRRSGRIHWITGFGDVLISITSGIKWEAE
ncbi:hypothetical protein [Klebsiella oxytoca]|uniref:hypothetical protein n=1 Tax=Klebsiella oxytoca TaxID=571 RepID=UPI002599A291|nr:hypothetical protein [Klebsiella oxytoca]MDM4366062.1 hypothetical protein [Klebsiella oxytoca]